MATNIERYKKDIEGLLKRGDDLYLAMAGDVAPEQLAKSVAKESAAERRKLKASLPVFRNDYQPWYSEALALLKQILPDRVDDFKRLYEPPRNRKDKDISVATYTIEDYIKGIEVRRDAFGLAQTTVVDKSAALQPFWQQLSIVRSAQQRFESSLFDIQQLVRADLFDSELDAAKELNKHGFHRAAGAVAGVVLEKHLAAVCRSHRLAISKRNPAISDFNEALKSNKVIEIPQWRFISMLGDLRNLCDHNKKEEPTADQIIKLIDGVAETIKSLL